jgi:tetratricopeptide (TPR) repeat protein
MNCLRILLIVAFVATAPAAYAQADADKPQVTINIGGEARITDRKVIADGKTVVTAYQALRSGGYPALKPHLSALEKALDRAPASYPKIESSDGRVLVRADPGDDTAPMTGGALVAAAMQGKSVSLERTLNVYPIASLLLASSSLEAGDVNGAIAWLGRGLKLQPRSAMLLSEKGAALLIAKRPAEALATYSAGLDMEDLLAMPDADQEAILLRGKGYALGELGRFDEAIAAYEEALKQAPGDRLAQNELRYIRSLKASAPAP